MINRRKFVGITLGAGAALALTPERLFALQQPGKLMQRAIPSSGEMLPVISFGPRPTGAAIPGVPFKSEPTDVPAARDVLRTFIDNGGRLVDVLHGGPIGEESARTAAVELGIQNKLTWTTPLSVPPVNVGPTLPGAIRKVDPAAVRAGLEAKFAKFNVSSIDLVMVGAGTDMPTYLAVLREMKKEGRVRYMGVHTLAFPPSPNSTRPPFGDLEDIMRTEQIDVVGTDYSVGDRRAEATLLPLALERRTGFMAYFPFDRGRLLQRVGNTPLPAWAAEFDAKTWAQFCLKYVLSHPAVIMARTGTTNAAHMLDNIGGGIGRMPNDALRKRMAELVDSIPVPPPPPAPPPPPGVTTLEQAQQLKANQAPGLALSAGILDRYVGTYKHEAAGTMVTVRRDGDKLLVKVQTSLFTEEPFLARSETRFESIPYVLEFLLDAQGKVTGATWRQGAISIPLVRM